MHPSLAHPRAGINSWRRNPEKRWRTQLSIEALEDRVVPASGIPDKFVQTGVGGGAALYSPRLHPTNTEEMYISSGQGSLFRSTNGGESWTTIDYRQIQGGPDSQVQYSSGTTLYAIDSSIASDTPRRRPMKSTDNGVTWQPLSNDPTGANAYKIFADPSDNRRVIVSDFTKLYFSSNGGSSFTTVFTSSNNTQGLHVAGIFWDGQSIYMGTNSGLLFSVDGLSTPFNVSNATGIPANEAILSFAGGRENSTTRFFAVTKAASNVRAGIQGDEYLGTQKIYSLDWGNSSWSLRQNGIDNGANYPFFVTMAANEIDIAYVGGGSNVTRPVVFRTSDAGNSWQSVLNTNANQNVVTGWMGRNGDRDWNYANAILGLTVAATNPNRVLITDFGFAHLSTDGGATWQQLYVNPADANPSGTDTPKGRNYASSGLDSSIVWDVSIFSQGNKIVASAADLRAIQSDNAGVKFNLNYAGFPAGNGTMFHTSVGSNGTIFGAVSSVKEVYQINSLTDGAISAATGAVVFSTDGASTWQTMRTFEGAVTYVTVDPNNPNRVFAAVGNSDTTKGGIWVTTNANLGSGASWTKLATPPRTQGHAFNIHVLNDGTLVASFSGRRAGANLNFTQSSGVFVSTNNGASWVDRSAPGMQYWTQDVVIDPHAAGQNTWYACVYSGTDANSGGLGGLYKTTDRGQNWTRVNSLSRVTSVAFNPFDQNDMMLTTESQGLWYSANARLATPTFNLVSSFPYRQPTRVVYNPANNLQVYIGTRGNGLILGKFNPPPGTISFTVGSFTVGEGGLFANITAQRTGGDFGVVGAEYFTTDISATAGADYIETTGVVTWADGDTANKTILVPILDDALVEGEETFQIALRNAIGGATIVGPSTAVVRIVDNDLIPAGAITFDAAAYSVNENGGTVTITVNRINGDNGNVSVQYSTDSFTATAGIDFISTSGTFTWGPGDSTPRTFTVTILNDAIIQGNRIFKVNLANVTGGAIFGPHSAADVTIVDDDLPLAGKVQFAVDAYQAMENDGSVVVTVVRVNGNLSPITVTYSTSNGTAVAGSDYVATSGTLSWADGDAAPKTFTITLINDGLAEQPETVNITLSNLVGFATFGTPTTAVLTILDDDLNNAPPTVRDDSFNLRTGESLNVAAPGLLSNDSDLNGFPLTAVLISRPANGDVVLQPNGSFLYVPVNNFSGFDFFTYTANNGIRDGNIATVMINVIRNLPPLAVSDSYLAFAGQLLSIPAASGVIANDRDENGDALTATLVAPPPVGLLSFNANGSFNYAPPAGFRGNVQFTYRLNDGLALSQPATVTLKVVNPVGLPSQTVVTGTDAGLPGQVKVYDGENGLLKFTITPYDPGYLGGVRVATADVNGDGVPDIITAPGAGMAPIVRVFNGIDGTPLLGTLGTGITAFAGGYQGGVSIAVGDFTGDGRPDIVVAMESGPLSTVRVFNGVTGLPLAGNLGGFSAYANTMKGGVRVAVGDVNGDGVPDIVTVPASGFRALVRVYSGKVVKGATPTRLREFNAFPTTVVTGFHVAAGQLLGDQRAEIVVGTGAGTPGQVRVYGTTNTPLRTIHPFGTTYTGGVRVGVGDVNGDGKLDLLFGSGPGLAPQVRFYDATTLAELFSGLGPLFPYTDLTQKSGVTLAGWRLGV